MSTPFVNPAWARWRLMNLAIEQGVSVPSVDLVWSEDRAWREWRAEARAAGVCVLCGKEPAVPDLDGFCEIHA